MTSRRYLLVLLAACGLNPCAMGQATSASNAIDLDHIKSELTDEIESILRDTGTPSISIVLMKDDQIVWQQAFGFANRRKQVKATPETVYGTGSCLKPVTAMAVMQLVDQGRIELDAPINKYLRKNPIRDRTDGGKPVTPRHLLSHYSGLSVRWEMIPVGDRRLPRTLSELAAELEPEVDPGTRFLYSNSDFAMAGLLVEEVSGHDFEQYLVNHILRPLNIELAGPINPTPEMLEELALPYRLEQDTAVPERRHRFDVFPAGDAYLTAPAMARILLAMMNAGQSNGVRLVSEESMQEMCSPQFGGQSGMDFGLREHHGSTLVTHGGGVPGYSTKFILDIDSRVGVYVAANAGGLQQPNRLLASRAIDLLHGRTTGGGLVREAVGLGAVLDSDEESGLIRIREVLHSSPARRAGLRAGMLINSIDDKPLEGRTLQDCLKLLGGEKETTVRLVVQKGKSTQTIDVVRGTIRIPTW